MDVARLLLGILVAVTLPGSVPALRRRPIAAVLVSFAAAAWAVVPVLDGWAACNVVLTTVFAGLGVVAFRCSLSPGERFQLRPGPWSLKHLLTWAWLLVALLPLAVAWLVYHGSGAFASLAADAGRDEVAIAIFGALLAVFAGNDLAYAATRSYVSRLRRSGQGAESIIPAGIHVGWVERAVVFAFVAGGQADAAAMAVAAKALIRLPELQDESKGSELGEYIIVGTLASVLAAIVAAVATRLALGLSAL